MKKNGFTLIDVLIGTALLVIIMTSVFSSFHLLFRILSQSQGKIVAIDLAREQIEIIRNLPYQDVGVENGIPSGEIPSSTIKQINNKTYTITTDIAYIDDPFDGISPEDTFPADYKKAEIQVSWEERQQIKSVIEIANLSPPNLESEVGGGTFSIYVNNTESGDPISNAQVKITNHNIEPNVDLFAFTDNNGWVSRPGLSESDDYKIISSKTSYDQHQTYAVSESLEPNPEYSHAQIIEGEKTTRYFTISESSIINIKTVDDENQAIADISFTLKGGRAIGTNPITESIIYSYEDNNLITNSEGIKELDNMSGGEYYLEITSPNYNVLAPDLEIPIIVGADAVQLITIVLELIN